MRICAVLALGILAGILVDIEDASPQDNSESLPILQSEEGIKAPRAEWLELYTALKIPALDETHFAPVENITLRRDAGAFHLEKGNLFSFKPVSTSDKEHVTGALFIGQGSFSFSPSTEVEKDHLARFMGRPELQQPFKVLFLRFTDSTFVELENQLSFTSTPPAEIIKEFVEKKEECERYLADDANEDIIYYLLNDLISDLDQGCFYAHIDKELKGRQGKPLTPEFFIYNPSAEEEVKFQKRFGVHPDYIRETVNQFHRIGDYRQKIDLSTEVKDQVLPQHYLIEASIGNNGEFSASAEVTLEVMAEQVQIFRFGLYWKVKILEIIDGDGNPLSHFRADQYAPVTVLLNTPLKKGERTKISLKYSGEIVKKHGAVFYILSSGGWYPRFGYRERATFDLTFRTPKRYEFVAIGKKVEDRTEKKDRITRWVQKIPSVNASFNLGHFKLREVSHEGVPPVGMMSGGRQKMAKNAEADILNSLHFFEYLYGPYPYEKLYASAIPFYHGESFPGLLHLSSSSFNISGKRAEVARAGFRAHEVAHQWWGSTVGYKTYHDQWLSEGFAEYSGLWYIQWVLKDNETFFELLDNWQKRILSNRKYFLNSGQEAGPISLGYRTSSSQTVGDYGLLIYAKGGFLLHMLRNLFLDLQTMNEDQFQNMMREYFDTYKHKAASTEDFKKIVEKHIGFDMDWLFNQWVDGTDIPTYRFSYTTSQNSDGEYLVSCRVRQTDVPGNFKMFVPMSVKLKDNRVLRMRVLIDRPEVEWDLQPLPDKPEKIIFNDFHSVLAKVEYD